jgi:hypothetical protein
MIICSIGTRVLLQCTITCRVPCDRKTTRADIWPRDCRARTGIDRLRIYACSSADVAKAGRRGRDRIWRRRSARIRLPADLRRRRVGTADRRAAPGNESLWYALRDYISATFLRSISRVCRRCGGKIPARARSKSGRRGERDDKMVFQLDLFESVVEILTSRFRLETNRPHTSILLTPPPTCPSRVHGHFVSGNSEYHANKEPASSMPVRRSDAVLRLRCA